ncbi:MAG: hypothetical protein ACRC7O_06355 [Fimbriiglobus sp.]
MLVVGRSHVRWFLATAALTAGAVGWYLAEYAAGTRLPGGSSRVGLVLGTVGAGIIAFEMLLWPRKRFPGVRTLPLGRTKHWMAAHIWLGLLCVPLAVLHTGFRFGGPLTTGLMAVFFVVIASGIWGLFLQQTLPRRMLDAVPDEVPAAEIDRVLAVHAAEFARKLAADCGEFGAAPLPGIETVAAFFTADARPYLLGESRSPALREGNRAADVFAELRATAAGSADRIRDLEELCNLRRQLDAQARMHWWLHNWVWVHLPLSVALVGLLVAHIYTALRYI